MSDLAKTDLHDLRDKLKQRGYRWRSADTIDISGQRIRLHGIDTPESKQTCQRGGVTWLCGAEATKILRELISGSDVSCTERDQDRYGRIVAVCHANDRNLNAAMVLSGTVAGK